MRSLPNCKIDFAAADEMFRATAQMLPGEDDNPDYGQIIGAYLGWALDEIDRQAKRIAELEARCNSLHSVSRRRKAEIDDLISDRLTNHATIAKQRGALKKLGKDKRERGKALVEERAYAIECNPNRTIEWTHEQAKERAREQLHREGKL